MKTKSMTISKAWKIVEKMLENKFELDSICKMPRLCEGKWYVKFVSLRQRPLIRNLEYEGVGIANTAPEAIYIAAVNAINNIPKNLRFNI